MRLLGRIDTQKNRETSAPTMKSHLKKAILWVLGITAALGIARLVPNNELAIAVLLGVVGGAVSAYVLLQAKHKAALASKSCAVDDAKTTGAVEATELATDDTSKRKDVSHPPLNPNTTDANQTLSSTEAPVVAEDDGEPAYRRSQLDFTEFTKKLLESPDPLGELKLFAAEVRERENFYGALALEEADLSEAEPNDTVSQLEYAKDEEPLLPCGVELFLAHRLYESGLFDEKIELPHIRIVRPHASGMLYLRIEQGQLPYSAILTILRIEAALNALRFAYSYFEDPQDASEEDVAVLQQRITSSIVAQAAAIDTPIELPDGVEPDGEWAVRNYISTAIESFQLPYRLTASWRTNVADGNVAIEIQLIPSDVFPNSWAVPMLNDKSKRVQTTKQMRRQMASAYAIRLALLLAASAFRASSKIKHVWIAGILDTSSRHDCYLSVDFDRWRFAKTELDHTDDLEKIMRPFCPVMRLEDGFLRPVTQSFSLAEERFCPRRRYESVSMSTRKLPKHLAHALGTDHVSGLAIQESEKREAIADDILRRLVAPVRKNATQHNVHTILELAGDDPDPSVRSAAERTANALVRGSIDGEPQSVVEEFMTGDVLSRACELARRALQAHNASGALEVLRAALEPLDAAGTYADSPQVEWRFFSSFVDRALYNRIHKANGRSLMLIPDTYYNAHVLAVMAELAEGHVGRATEHARELVRIAPLDAHAKLQLIRCLEASGNDKAAVELLTQLLKEAHDPQAVGTAYYRMAFFQWKQGNILAARACYQMATQFVPAAMPTIAMELTALSMQTGIKDAREPLSPTELHHILETHHIPESPTDEMSGVFMECAQASLDAEVFPVARNFLSTLAAFTPDDIIVGMMNSLESFPDSL